MVGLKIRVLENMVGPDPLKELWRKWRTIYIRVHGLSIRVVRSEVRVVGSGLLGPDFDKEAEVLSTSASEAFFIDCISSWRDFIASSMDA